MIFEYWLREHISVIQVLLNKLGFASQFYLVLSWVNFRWANPLARSWICTIRWQRSQFNLSLKTVHQSYISAQQGLCLPLQWHHNGHNGISNHQPPDCLLNRLFRCRSQKTSKLCVTGLCVGNSLVTSEFPAQMASNTENVSIWNPMCKYNSEYHSHWE